MKLTQRTAPTADFTAAELALIAELTPDRYVPEILGPRLATPGATAPTITPEQLRSTLLTSFGSPTPGEITSALFAAGPEGERIALAAARIRRSDRALPVHDTIGDPTSPLPTHQGLLGFRYPAAFAPTLPEAAVGEFTRVAAIELRRLLPLIGRGWLTRPEADAVAACGVFATIAGAYWHDQESTSPAQGYVFAAKGDLVDVLSQRYRLHIAPLYADGITPRPDMLADPLYIPLFRPWWEALTPLVPPDVLAAGLDVAIRHLVQAGFDGWSKLPLRLPHLLLNDRQTAVGMHRLAGLLPARLGLGALAA